MADKHLDGSLSGVRVLYIGNFRFPYDVAATRVLAIAKALRTLGADVTFAGGEEAGRAEDLQADGRYLYQGFEYISMNELRTKHLTPIKRLTRYYFAGQNTARWLKGLGPNSFDLVIVYNPMAGLLQRILPYCRKHKIPVIVDATEWHDPSHFVGGRLGFQWWDLEWTMRALLPRAGHVIAISTYLENYYKSKQAHVIRIPALVDFEEPRINVHTNTPGKNLPLRVMYAGNPAKKDCIVQILEACCMARERDLPIVLEIAGISMEQLMSMGETVSGHVLGLGSHLVVHGRFPTSEQAIKKMAEADILLVVKFPSRSAEAQFPTKLVEYMALGRPILANNTSDVAMYVRDNIEGFLIENHHAESIFRGLRRAVESRGRLEQMGKNSYQSANLHFDYNIYSDKLRKFIMDLL